MTNDPDFMLLHSTKDPALLSAITALLDEAGIEYTVLDECGASMLSFLPDAEIRIIVGRERYDEALELVNDLILEE